MVEKPFLCRYTNARRRCTYNRGDFSDSPQRALSFSKTARAVALTKPPTESRRFSSLAKNNGQI